MFYGLIRLKGLLGLLIFGGLWSSTPALATVEDEGYTAIAAAGSQGTQYRTSPRSTLLEASRAALTECRGAEMEGRANGCELIELNGQVLTTSNQLRARLPDKPYPLFLWEYQIGASTVYLAGSIHILPASLHPLPQPLYDAFDRSDRLVLEVNTQAHTPEALQFKAMQYAMLPPDQSLREVLGAELHADLATIMQPYGMELAPLERFKPAFVTQQLALL
ncbi:MAG: TraB/GumN family protein, partial [Pseudomonadota bacterium]